MIAARPEQHVTHRPWYDGIEWKAIAVASWIALFGILVSVVGSHLVGSTGSAASDDSQTVDVASTSGWSNSTFMLTSPFAAETFLAAIVVNLSVPCAAPGFGPQHYFDCDWWLNGTLPQGPHWGATDMTSSPEAFADTLTAETYNLSVEVFLVHTPSGSPGSAPPVWTPAAYNGTVTIIGLTPT